MRKLMSLLGMVLVVMSLLTVVNPVAAQTTMSQMSATLSGAAEVPGPGDTDGTGTSTVTVDTSKNEVCWTINVSAITLPAAAAHIHTGAAGVAGPVVVPLSAPDANGTATGCGMADAAVIAAIVANPAGHYVNVHTSDFPAGAVRGQLAMAAAPPMMPTTGGVQGTLALPLLVAGALLLLGSVALRRYGMVV